MTKKIIVDCCEHCPWHDLGYDGDKESYFPICWNKVEDFQGTLPGCYKFRRPWYADGMIEMHIYRHALTKVRDLLPGEDGDDSVSGYVCEECALKGVSA